MTTIQTLYEALCNWADEFTTTHGGTVHITAQEGRSGVTIGSRPDHPQYIFVEFTEPVPEEGRKNLRIALLEQANGTDWEVVDEDGVYEGETGEVSFHREVPADEVSPMRDEFEESATFD